MQVSAGRVRAIPVAAGGCGGRVVNWSDLSTLEQILTVVAAVTAMGGAAFVFAWRR